MNNPLPAALASIKRYTFLGRSGLARSDNGELVKLADVLAILPPPADGAVTDAHIDRALDAATRFVDPGFTSRDRMRAALIAAYAAPPADSAMVEALRKLVESWRSDQSDHTPSNEMMSRWRCAAQLERTLLAGRK